MNILSQQETGIPLEAIIDPFLELLFRIYPSLEA